MTDSERQNSARRVTLKQVAIAAEVSPMTVSNYVNGHHHLMSDAVRDRVAHEISRLNYRRNDAARNLRQSRLLSIGMLIVDNSPTYLADGYTTQIVAGASNHLTDQGFSLLLQGIRPDDFETSPLVTSIRTDGLCALLSGDDESRLAQIETLKRVGQPLIVFLEKLDTAHPDICSIRQNEFESGRVMGEHVSQRSPSTVVLLAASDNRWAAVVERMQGMVDGLESGTGTPRIISLDCGTGGFDDTQAALGSYISSDGMPDAIMSVNDQMAIAAMQMVQNRGAAIPDDVLVTGFNAFDFRRYAQPELTSIRSPAYEMGARAAAEMLNRLETGTFRENEIIFPFEFLKGQST